MKHLNSGQLPGRVIGLVCGVAVLAVACASPTPSLPAPANSVTATRPSAPAVPPSTPTLANSPSPSAQITPTPTERWIELLMRMPFPYTTPLPPPTPSVLDGIYAKFEDREGTPIPCRRCPDYAPERGIWRLNLEKGVFRVYYQFWNWTSLGSFTVSGDHIAFFNDPNCYEDVGTYTWKLEEDKLTFKVIADDCAIALRAKNLTMRPWLSCQPPNREAGITDHWLKPPGCYQPTQ